MTDFNSDDVQAILRDSGNAIVHDFFGSGFVDSNTKSGSRSTLVDSGWLGTSMTIEFAIRDADFGDDTVQVGNIVITQAQVPAPGALWLLGTGLAGLMLRRRRKA